MSDQYLYITTHELIRKEKLDVTFSKSIANQLRNLSDHQLNMVESELKREKLRRDPTLAYE